MANFSQKYAYSTYLRYPMSIRANDPVCLQAILTMRVPLFPSGMLFVTSIMSINCNNTDFCFELNGEYTGECFVSLQFIVLRYTPVNLKIIDFAKI